MKQVLKKIALGIMLSATALSAAVAQTVQLPSTIKIVVPFSPGAGTDITARMLAKLLGEKLGANVIVENKPGASGMIGARQVANGPKDGSELMVFSNSLITAAATLRNVPFDLVKDLQPVAVLSDSPMLIAVPANSPLKTPADLVKAAKARPGELNHGSGGLGTIAPMTVELMNAMADMKIAQVPYKGAAPAITDLAAGNLDLVVAAYSSFASMLESGRIRLFAVTSKDKVARFPDVPAMSEAIPGLAANVWQTLWAPAGVPEDVMNALNKAVVEVTHSEEFGKLIQGEGGVPSRQTPAELKERLKTEYETWRKIAKDNNIVVD